MCSSLEWKRHQRVLSSKLEVCDLTHSGFSWKKMFIMVREERHVGRFITGSMLIGGVQRMYWVDVCATVCFGQRKRSSAIATWSCEAKYCVAKSNELTIERPNSANVESQYHAVLLRSRCYGFFKNTGHCRRKQVSLYLRKFCICAEGHNIRSCHCDLRDTSPQLNVVLHFLQSEGDKREKFKTWCEGWAGINNMMHLLEC